MCATPRAPHGGHRRGMGPTLTYASCRPAPSPARRLPLTQPILPLLSAPPPAPQAAHQLYGLPPHVAQSCTAMLSSPGGLFLDIKSGYSTAPQLRAFASTLAGIGVYTKVCVWVCAYVGVWVCVNVCVRARKAWDGGQLAQFLSTHTHTTHGIPYTVIVCSCPYALQHTWQGPCISLQCWCF